MLRVEEIRDSRFKKIEARAMTECQQSAERSSYIQVSVHLMGNSAQAGSCLDKDG